MLSRCGPPEAGLVTSSKVICSTAPAATVRPANSAHWTARPTGFEQLPTATPAARTLPPPQPAKAVPAGNVTSMRLLASCASPPVPESVERTT